MARKGVNRVTLIGNLGQDPEVRYLPSGGAVCNISVATSETWKDKDTGEPKEKTEWTRCVAFRKPAEIIGEYMKKGSKIYIEGHLQTRKWEKEGQDHYTTEVVIDEFQFLDSKGSGGGQQSSGGGQQQPQAAPADDGFADDIPF